MSGQSHSSENAGALSTQQLHSGLALAPDTILANRFRIISRLGSGAQASVYAAYDTLLEINIALKLIAGVSNDAQSMQTIRNEVVLARKLQHPNIVRVHDVFNDGNCVFFTMAQLHGVPLHQRLMSPVTRAEYSQWSAQLLGALEACHQAGVRHGDIKPDNLLIDENGDLQVIDFGIGQNANREDTSQTSGHEKYSAPEVLHTGTPSPTSDIYSAGKVLSDILEAVRMHWTSCRDIAWRWRQRRFIRRLTSSTPAQRPSVSEVIKQGERSTFPVSAIILLSVTITALLISYQHFFAENDNLPPLEDGTIPVSVIYDPALPLLETMADMLSYSLTAEPGLSLVDAEATQRYISNLSLQPWNNGQHRADLAAAFGATIMISLDATPTSDSDYLLRAKVLRMPAGRVYADVTQDVHSTTLEQDIHQFGQRLVNQLYSRLSLQTPPPDMRFLTTLANTSEGNEIPVKAIQSRFPDYPGGWLMGAQQAYEANNLLSANEQLEHLFSLSTESDYWHLQGQLLRAQMNGDLALAMQSVDALITQFPDRPELFAIRAQVHQWANDNDAAKRDYESAIHLAPYNGQYLFELGKLEIISGDIQHAIDEPLTKALVAFRKSGDKAGEGLVLNGFGVAYLRLADYAVAQRYFSDSLVLRDAETQPFVRSTTLANLANVAAINGDYSLAERSLNEAHALLESLDDKPGQAHVLDTLGLLYEEQALYEKALIYYKRGLDLRVQANDTDRKGESMSNVAYMHFLMGDFSLAEIYWRQAQNQFENLSDKAHLLRTHQNLAQLSLVKGDNIAANRLLASVEELLSPDQLQESMYNRMLFSFLHFSEGRLAKAMSAIADAKAIAEETGDSRAWVEMGMWQSEMCLLTADWQCVSTTLNALYDEQSYANWSEPLAIVSWLNVARQFESGELNENDLGAFLDALSQQALPVVTELKIRLDLMQRAPSLLTSQRRRIIEDMIAPRFYQAYMQYLYLLSLQDGGDTTLEQQLVAHPGYWRNHLYYQALDDEVSRQRQQQLTVTWLTQLPESQASQYRQTYLERK